MNYGITIATVGDWPFIEITPDEFQRIKIARANLLVALGIEEKFQLLVDNYAEYESAVFSIAQQRMIRGDADWSIAMDDMLLLSRRLANVLTSGRLYTDQLKHEIADLFGKDSALSAKVKAAFSREYDAAIGYRVMEALRNYVQHQALPECRMRYGPEKVNRPCGQLIRYSLKLELDVVALRNSTFKASVLAELEQREEARNVTFALRQFLQGLSRVHYDIRNWIDSEVASWKATLDGVLEVGTAQIGQTNVLAAVARDDDGNHPEIIVVFTDIIKRLDALKSRYRDLGLLAGWFVSGEIG